MIFDHPICTTTLPKSVDASDNLHTPHIYHMHKVGTLIEEYVNAFEKMKQERLKPLPLQKKRKEPYFIDVQREYSQKIAEECLESPGTCKAAFKERIGHGDIPAIGILVFIQFDYMDRFVFPKTHEIPSELIVPNELVKTFSLILSDPHSYFHEAPLFRAQLIDDTMEAMRNDPIPLFRDVLFEFIKMSDDFQKSSPDYRAFQYSNARKAIDLLVHISGPQALQDYPFKTFDFGDYFEEWHL